MSEHDTQASFFQWVSLNELLIPALSNFYAIPNGGQRHIQVARKLKREGVKSGVPDTHLAYPSRPYHGLYLEFKEPSNRPTTNQVDWLTRLTKAGFKCAVVYSLEEAINVTTVYLSPRRSLYR